MKDKETNILIETSMAIQYIDQQLKKGVELIKAKNKAFDRIKSVVKPYVIYRVNKYYIK
jgi:hypothetical protein